MKWLQLRFNFHSVQHDCGVERSKVWLWLSTLLCFGLLYKWKKKRSERRKQCAGYSKAEPKIFAPPQTPFPGARDGQNLISWRRSLRLPTKQVWWGSMHAISSFRGNRPTKPQTHNARPPARPLQTRRQDRLQYTEPLSLARSVIMAE